MLRSRLIAGSLLALAAGAMLVGDEYLAPYFPCLFVCVLVASLLASRELLLLLPSSCRPSFAVIAVSVTAVLASNWIPHVAELKDPWKPTLFVFAVVAILIICTEMASFREPGTSVARISAGIFAVVYLGILPSFFVQLRWSERPPAWLALALTVFVPKCGDIGAYFTGRFLGRTKFAPLLSPKKTWEGFVGGMATSMATAVGLSFAGPAFQFGIVEAVAFGLAIGLAGVLGDLAESLIKRDAGTKDAAKSIPGFGGVLDVIDSLVFAGPVAYIWWNSL